MLNRDEMSEGPVIQDGAVFPLSIPSKEREILFLISATLTDHNSFLFASHFKYCGIRLPNMCSPFLIFSFLLFKLAHTLKFPYRNSRAGLKSARVKLSKGEIMSHPPCPSRELILRSLNRNVEIID